MLLLAAGMKAPWGPSCLLLNESIALCQPKKRNETRCRRKIERERECTADALWCMYRLSDPFPPPRKSIRFGMIIFLILPKYKSAMPHTKLRTDTSSHKPIERCKSAAAIFAGRLTGLGRLKMRFFGFEASSRSQKLKSFISIQNIPCRVTNPT